MRYNDCLDCDQPIGMYQDRCDDCTKKLIMCLSDGQAMVDMENGILKQKIKELENKKEYFENSYENAKAVIELYKRDKQKLTKIQEFEDHVLYPTEHDFEIRRILKDNT